MPKKHRVPQPFYEKGKFEGKVVIVTGSSSGIGQATAMLFALEGASVTLHGQNLERLKACAKAIVTEGVPSSKILSIQGSVDDDNVLQKLVDETVKKFGKLDILINNAGISNKPGVPMTDNLTMENYEYVMNVNLRAPIRLTQLAVPHLAKTHGNVINVSSIGGLRPVPATMYYSIAKAALDHFTRNAAVMYAKHGVRVNGLIPGGVETAFVTRHGVPQCVANKLSNDYTDKYVPMKRYGVPNEMATIIKFLASDEASYITGSNIVADGGTSIFVPGRDLIESFGDAVKLIVSGP